VLQKCYTKTLCFTIVVTLVTPFFIFLKIKKKKYEEIINKKKSITSVTSMVQTMVTHYVLVFTVREKYRNISLPPCEIYSFGIGLLLNIIFSEFHIQY
jgi:hypothetical protein